MTSATPRLSRVIFAAAATFVLAAPAAAAPAFLKLGGVDGSTKGKDSHKDEIEILSYSWGASQTSSAGMGGGHGSGKVVVHDISATGVEREMKESGEKGGTEDINIGVGELQESRGGVSVAAGDVNGDGRADIVSPRDSASGMPTGKRQHGWVTVSKPLDRGAVRVKVKFPWVGCTVGARYPSLELGGGGKSYVLRDVTVASCGSASGDADDRPTEEVAFYYNKIAFNYAASPDAP